VLGGGDRGDPPPPPPAPRLGAEVTLVERDIVGGAAHLWDCIPSKAMIATGGELAELARSRSMGLHAQGRLDIEAVKERVSSIEARLHAQVTGLLDAQRVRVIMGSARFKGPH